jgi:polyhydroxyalkanoate synthase
MLKKPTKKEQGVGSDTTKQRDMCADEANSENFFKFFDQLFQANLAKMTLGISPAALGTAYYSWLAQLAQSPGRLLELSFYPILHSSDCANKILGDQQPGGGDDVRFRSENWQFIPWRLWAENFLLVEAWWRHATQEIPGVSGTVERTVSFSVRQILDALSPANFVFTNPDLFNETLNSGGTNIIRGTEIAINDMLEKLAGSPPAGVEHFVPGKDVAITPGRVVYHNHLIEVIQYDAQTTSVLKEPILIIPAWIMKYYILDLSPHNSLVKWLVNQGHTVFIVSWRNPDSKDRDLGMDDYYRLGAMAAIDTVSKIIPKTKLHLMGYCLGGTLAIITAAAMAMNEDKRLKSLTLLAAQGDFTEAGELMLFINESEVAFLENMMWDQGYLDTKQMAGSFQMLRSYDLIWSKIVQDYMHGTERDLIDLLAWNADATRMPYKMHSEYLEKLFLNNELASGHFTLEGSPIVAENIHIPVFALSTEKDHVAPWKSVYKIHLMVNSDVTFALVNGGHNGGILSEPGHGRHSYRLLEHKHTDPYIGPDDWLEAAPIYNDSWWYAWHDWLVKHSAREEVAARDVDKSSPAAPGTYVLQK